MLKSKTKRKRRWITLYSACKENKNQTKIKEYIVAVGNAANKIKSVPMETTRKGIIVSFWLGAT